MKGTAMFKNRAIQVQMVKKNQTDTSDNTETVGRIDPEQLNRIAQEQVQNIALAVGTVLAAKVILNTVSEISIIAAKSKFH